ncbi:hypothetical protein GBA65_11205 [Rubrobacter marinus]|uniref:HTH luxR-type domain-containing protein n=2 Tax=Rubrobacter marinus TaxID=2653852 RepID=A0A6G8Q2R1_9ACTN|nr:hypothetical protein GBA65_11205 [Rubrobacter marinus]
MAIRGWASRKDAIGGAKGAERELLAALREYGELTPTAAAMLTPLTVAQAAEELEKLAREGHLEARTREGAISYAMREGDRRAVPSAQSEARTRPIGNATGEATPPARPAQTLPDPLTGRELAVLRLLAAGRTNREIARELFVAEGTVKAHVAGVYRKLGVHSRAEAASRAADLNLL